MPDVHGAGNAVTLSGCHKKESEGSFAIQKCRLRGVPIAGTFKTKSLF